MSHTSNKKNKSPLSHLVGFAAAAEVGAMSVQNTEKKLRHSDEMHIYQCEIEFQRKGNAEIAQ